MKNTALKLYVKLSTKVRELADDSRGLTAVEYAVLGALVVGAVIAAGGSLKDGLNNAFEAMMNSIPAPTST